MNYKALIPTGAIALLLGLGLYRSGRPSPQELSVQPTPALVSSASPVAASPAPTIPAQAPVAPAPEPQPPLADRHDLTLAAQEALEGFAQTFVDALNRGDEGLASELFLLRLAKVPQKSSAIYAFMKPYMDQYPLLWQQPTAVGSYWSACVEEGCDQSALLRNLRSTNPAYYEAKAACLESWGLLIVLAKQRKVTAPPGKLTAVEKALDTCLERNSFTDATIVTQVQFYLYYLQQSRGVDAARKAYGSLAASYEGMPPLSEMLAGQK